MIRYLAVTVLVSLLLAAAVSAVVIFLVVLAAAIEEMAQYVVVPATFLIVGASITWVFGLHKPEEI